MLERNTYDITELYIRDKVKDFHDEESISRAKKRLDELIQVVSDRLQANNMQSYVRKVVTPSGAVQLQLTNEGRSIEAILRHQERESTEVSPSEKSNNT